MPELMPYYFISAFLFYAITKEAIGIFFVKRDFNYLIEIILWILFIVTDSFFSFIVEDPAKLIFVQILYSVLLCEVLYSGGIKEKIIWIAVINLIGMLVETIVGYVFLILGMYLDQHKIFGSLVSKIIALTVVLALKAANRHKLRKDIPFTYWIVICLIPIGSIFVLHTIFSLCWESGEQNRYFSALIASGILMAIILIMLRVYENLVDYVDAQKQRVAFKKQIDMYKEQIRIQDESNADIKSIKHDIKNHLVCLQGYLTNRDYERANIYIEEMLNDGNLYSREKFICSGNAIVDALLNYKYSRAEKANIIFESHIEIPHKISINDTALSIVIGNCLDNAIEAVSCLDSTTERRIIIEIVYRKSVFLIKISNPYNGIIKRDRDGRYLTTKQVDVQNHGTGLNSVFRVVEKNHGTYRIEDTGGWFRIQIMLYG